VAVCSHDLPCVSLQLLLRHFCEENGRRSTICCGHDTGQRKHVHEALDKVREGHMAHDASGRGTGVDSDESSASGCVTALPVQSHQPVAKLARTVRLEPLHCVETGGLEKCGGCKMAG
jgi:hypothetical protein